MSLTCGEERLALGLSLASLDAWLRVTGEGDLMGDEQWMCSSSRRLLLELHELDRLTQAAGCLNCSLSGELGWSAAELESFTVSPENWDIGGANAVAVE